VALGLILPQALSAVPRFSGDSKIIPISGGMSNRSYRVTTVAGEFCVRVNDPTGVMLGANHEIEVQIQCCAAELLLAPKIVHFDPQHQFLITEFIDGRVWTEQDLQQPAQVAKLAATLQRVQQIPPPLIPPFAIAKHLHALLDVMPTVFAVEQVMALCSDIETDDSMLKGFHGDLSPSNIIERPSGELCLLDWEYAGVGHADHDWAMLAACYPVCASSITRYFRYPAMAQRVWLATLLAYLWYRHRRTLVAASAAEIGAEHALLARLQKTLPCNAGIPPATPAD
jgi:aminoglycoside phosphotransferase (APT) family kinase protein